MPALTPPLRTGVALALVAWAGCAAPLPEPASGAQDAAVARAEAAGLTAAQAQQLLDVPGTVLLPTQRGAFEVVGFSTEPMGPFGGYSIRWRRPSDGACFRVEGVTDGLGGPAYPIVSTEVPLRELPGRPTVTVYQAADDPLATSAQTWGTGAVISEPIDLGPMHIVFGSHDADGCRPLDLREAASIVGGLRPLVPGALGTDEVGAVDGDLGAFAPADDVIEEAEFLAGPDPEAAARAYFTPWAEDGARVEVRTLSRTDRRAVVLVTLLDLADDSVRDERLRLLYEPSGAGWVLADAGRQQRCQPGRGHAGWEAALCR